MNQELIKINQHSKTVLSRLRESHKKSIDEYEQSQQEMRIMDYLNNYDISKAQLSSKDLKHASKMNLNRQHRDLIRHLMD